eukprot:TRINITY_DN38536_c0_g1_i1.p1 TRINITY_DN38536_c0_g1~~TRINITY_DN38536_c0_g1_i1.p1  ORF type:complete len:164 (-),score=33.24 TRINITY_DN38536_c0_g1_i1:23-514(-)
MAYLTPPLSRDVCGRSSPEDRLARVVELVESLVPGESKQPRVENATVQCWLEEPFARGVYAVFGPNQSRLADAAAEAHGRVHFAGEHTATWGGYMNGAIESGLRAAWEVFCRAAMEGGGAATASFVRGRGGSVNRAALAARKDVLHCKRIQKLGHEHAGEHKT